MSAARPAAGPDGPGDDVPGDGRGAGGPPGPARPLPLLGELRAEESLVAQAVGGWRGVVDSGLPSAVFVVVYLVDGSQLGPAVWAALAAAAAAAVWRLARRQTLQQVLSGLVGVGVSAFVAARTGRAEDFFLPGLLTNAAWALGIALSLAVRWPFVGLVVGGMAGDLTGWRRDDGLRRACTAASWLWLGLFALRMAVQVPLYLAGAVGPLGVAKIVLGWPLFLATAYVSYRVVTPALHRRTARREAEAGAADGGPGGAA